jgi:putative hydrolase of the HAD superfamily
MDPQPQAIFFDLDGTILDWQSGMDETWLASCEANCDSSFVPAQLYEAILLRRTWYWANRERAMLGRMDLNGASREIVRLAFTDAGLDSVEVAHRIADEYRARRTASIVPYPGAIETLDAIRARGIPMALLTNGEASHQRGNVERFALAPYFDCIVIEGEFGAGKPDERVFRHALAALACRPESTWMIGDNLEADIAPAVSLGLHAVWVDAERTGLPANAPAQPHRIVLAISELGPFA